MTEEEIQRYLNADRNAALYRGNFIHLMVAIESILEDIILNHFLKNADDNTYNEFKHAVLSKESFGFKFKFSTVAFIIKNHHKEVIENYPEFINTLEQYIDLRNVFAHRKFHSMSENNTSGDNIVFTNYTTKQNKIRVEETVISKNQLQEQFETINWIMKILNYLSSKQNNKG